MFSFKNLPLKRKLTAIILLACATALALPFAVLFLFQSATFRRGFERDLKAVAEIIAKNSTAAVAFHDRETAKEVLSAVRATPQIVGARIYLEDGAEFATFGKDQIAAGAKDNLTTPELRRIGGYLAALHPIIVDRKRLGMLHLYSNFAAENHYLISLYSLVLFGVLFFSLLIAYLVSNRLVSFISQPILRLTEISRLVAEKADYSMRLNQTGSDEVGVLTSAFNHMLSKIQAQDSALHEAHAKVTAQVASLESEVIERKKAEQALRFSQEKFEGLVNSLEGIVWEQDPKTMKFTFVSRQCERLLGFPQKRWLDDPGFLCNTMAPQDRERTLQAFSDGLQHRKPFVCEYRVHAADERVIWVRSSASIIQSNGEVQSLRGVLMDVTEQKEAELKIEALHKKLVDASRQAGMAEMATGVLHNVGNVLNSVNVSTVLIRERTQQTRLPNLGRALALIEEHRSDLPNYLTQDPKGQMLPGYLKSLFAHLTEDHQGLLTELDSLSKNVEHAKEIVAMQQSYATSSGVIEVVSVPELVEDALQMNLAAYERNGIKVSKDFKPVPLVSVDRHKTLQILMNLMRNANYAMDSLPPSRPRSIFLGIHPTPDGAVEVAVRDTGIGIAPENLTRIFQNGFSTRKSKGGHGFGLHTGAIAAKEMGGSLQAHSDGPNLGATFTLRLRREADKPTV